MALQNFFANLSHLSTEESVATGNADFLVGEVTGGILGPRVAVNLEGADAKTAAADFLVLAGAATALEQRPAIAMPACRPEADGFDFGSR